jgi:hypothetical protein
MSRSLIMLYAVFCSLMGYCLGRDWNVGAVLLMLFAVLIGRRIELAIRRTSDAQGEEK